MERLLPPIPDSVLAELIEVSAAINDAPMGELTHEDEKFDLQRMRDFQAAREGRKDACYRVIARHRETGEVGGHTVVVVNPLQPEEGTQADTAVSRDHRGHRLGMLLKIAMMRWLAEVEPQLKVLETWNNVENRYMIDVNEAIGYRLSRVYAMFELTLEWPLRGPMAGLRPGPVRRPQKPSRLRCLGSRCHSFSTLTLRSR